MNVTFRAKFNRGYGEIRETITVKFERNTMSESSIQACAKLALQDKCGLNHKDYHLESITEV